MTVEVNRAEEAETVEPKVLPSEPCEGGRLVQIDEYTKKFVPYTEEALAEFEAGDSEDAADDGEEESGEEES